MEPILIPVSPGELLDRAGILEIKAERITDPDKVRHVRNAVEPLRPVRQRLLAAVAGAAELDALLRSVNEALWEAEGALRRFEAVGEFGAGFVAVARSVLRWNEERHRLKRAIDAACGAAGGEVKWYAGGTGGGRPDPALRPGTPGGEPAGRSLDRPE